MPLNQKLTKADRKDVQDALDTLEDLGWSVTDYDVSVEQPVKLEETKLEVTAYK